MKEYYCSILSALADEAKRAIRRWFLFLNADAEEKSITRDFFKVLSHTSRQSIILGGNGEWLIVLKKNRCAVYIVTLKAALKHLNSPRWVRSEKFYAESRGRGSQKYNAAVSTVS